MNIYFVLFDVQECFLSFASFALILLGSSLATRSLAVTTLLVNSAFQLWDSLSQVDE